MPDPTDRLAALRERRRRRADDLSMIDAEIDALLLDMTATLNVTQVADFVGVSRQEVHRRIRRARERAL